MSVSEIEVGTRAKRGVVILKELKSNPHRIFNVLTVSKADQVLITTEKQIQETIQVANLSKADRYSNGSLKVDITNDGELAYAIKLKNQEKQ